MGHTQDPLAANKPTNDLLALAGVMDLEGGYPRLEEEGKENASRGLPLGSSLVCLPARKSRVNRQTTKTESSVPILLE